MTYNQYSTKYISPGVWSCCIYSIFNQNGGRFADWLLQSQSEESRTFEKHNALREEQHVTDLVLIIIAISILKEHSAFCGLATPIKKRGTISITKSGKIAINTIQDFEFETIKGDSVDRGAIRSTVSNQ